MKVYNDFNTVPQFNNAAVTSGFFDGVHTGHQQIIARLKEIARQNDGTTVVVTFWPHPKQVLQPDETSLKLLTTFEEKVELLRKQGVKNLVKIPFTKAFSEMGAKDFIKDILVHQIATQKLVIGHDHRFGKDRKGDFEQLRVSALQHGFEVEKIPQKNIDNVGVSSSAIRHLLLEGKVEMAARLLGRYYTLSGKVIRGDKIGRTMGFPTANLEASSPYKLIPQRGVYAVKIKHKDLTYRGMLYIGDRPTLNRGSRSIEVNIFDFDEDIYGEKITVDFIAPIREDIRFESLEALKKQMKMDRDLSLLLLNKSAV